MKRSILSIALLLTLTQAFCQEHPTPALTKTDYLRKGKAQKTAAWCLLGGGLGMLAGSLATYKIAIDLGPMFGQAPSAHTVDNTGSSVLAIGGAGALIGSVALFVSASHNKEKAASFTITNQPVQRLRQNSIVSYMQPAVQLHIPL